VADLNNDGKPDLVVADSGGSNVSVLVNLTVTGSMNAALHPGRLSPPAARPMPWRGGPECRWQNRSGGDQFQQQHGCGAAEYHHARVRHHRV